MGKPGATVATTPQARAEREARLAREAAALRENLRRRTAHRRRNETGDGEAEAPEGPEWRTKG